MKVLRVENAQGAGPYFWFAICDDLRFGFSSRDQFEGWFSADQRPLFRLGRNGRMTGRLVVHSA